MERLAVTLNVTGEKLLVPRLRLVFVEYRHPALGKPKFVKVAGKLRVRLLAREVL